MSTALYRKYRPDNFDNIIGQSQVIDVLKNQIKENKISHAYIFSGVRGTGKTSTAKVFAKAVNCRNYTDEKGVCNECDSCINNSMDTVEIDAASNNSVDNIRSLKDTIMYQPSFGKYRVYIIDEVHMLSTGAFNALLKTLEEPPSHVIFILATTELNKIPATILSRCQKFEFKKVSQEDIKSRLKYILDKENIKYDEQVVSMIADMSDGGLRDAISMLDQISSYGDITLENLNFVTGSASVLNIDEYIGGIFNKDILASLTAIKTMTDDSVDIKKIPSQVISRLIDMMYVQDGLEKQDIFEIDSMKKTLKNNKSTDIAQLIVSISDIENDMKYATMPDILFQSFTVKMCKGIKQENVDVSSLLSKIDYLEQKIEQLGEIGVIVSDNTSKVQEIKEDEQPVKKPPKVEEVRITEELSDKEEKDIELVNSLLVDVHSVLRDMKCANISAFLHEGSIRRYVEDSIYISYKHTHNFHKTMLEKNENLAILTKAFSQILSKNVSVVVVFDDEIINVEKKDENDEIKKNITDIFGDVNIEILDE